MIEQTGDTYQGSKYAKVLAASQAKVGKTCFLAGSILGVMPWQKNGGVIDKPSHLHIVAFDSNAVGGVKRFLLETCGARSEATGFRVYNYQDDARRVSCGTGEYDNSLFNSVLAGLQKIQERVAAERGVHAVLFSSLTGLASALERGIVGPPGKGGGESGKGYADANKWKMFAHQINELRNFAQVDDWHCFWEAHIDKGPPPMGKGEQPKESIHVSGAAGRNFAFNVEQVFKINRQIGEVFAATACDKVYFDTRPALDFIAGGRGSTEALAPKEYDLTGALTKLGLKVGGWGAMSVPAVKKVALAR